MTTARIALTGTEGPRIVGLGASAGGLEALEKFFVRVPKDTNLAFVVVQHIGAQYKTLLGTLLQQITTLPVHEANDGVVLAANAVYSIPTAGELTVVRGCLHFQVAKTLKSTHLPIDAFFISLAQDQGYRSVGVILSGMGRDGVSGLQAIRKVGGLCMAQLPNTAAFEAMPQNAIDANCVDVVAAPEDIPVKILQWSLHGPSKPNPEDAAKNDTTALTARTSVDDLQSIVELLHHDFSLYKPSTLRRRVERRVQVHQLPSMAAYKAYLQNNPPELNFLFSEMLIGVTSFFRDSQVWQDLLTLVLPKLLASSAHLPVRAWVLGCSTGEEAYSLAMIFHQAQDKAAQPSRVVQIFATDLNPAAIAVARKGWYSSRSLVALTEDQRARFFTPNNGGHLIQPAIRAMVTFAQHDVITDPPFTRLDLLLCRNVLIYFSATLQRRLMPLFHFNLRPEGSLVLGSAESVGRTQNLFTVRMSKSRIYERLEQAPTPGSVTFPVRRNLTSNAPLKDLSVPSSELHTFSNFQSLANQVLIETISPAAVLVNASGDILYTSGRVDLYLEPASSKVNWNIHAIVLPAWRASMATALRQAMLERLPVVFNNFSIGDQHNVQVTVHPLDAPPSLANTAMILFKDEEAKMSRKNALDASVSNSQSELFTAQTELQALHAAMQTSKEQFSVIHESLKTANEKLQSANEELTTAHEESQSMNEELHTINSELQSRLDDSALAQSDMQNLLNSTDIATLFLDNDLNVRRFTEKTVGIFHLREVDVGRPLSDLANILSYPSLLSDVKETLRTLTPCTKSVAATDGRWFSVRIMPYRTLANAVNGAVLTFVDISTAKTLEFRLRESQSPRETDKDST